MAFRRWSALVLLLALVGGGLGLPVADALVYHSSPTQRTAPASHEVALGAVSTTQHLQGCVLSLGGLSGSGIVGAGSTVAVAAAIDLTASYPAESTSFTQTGITLGLSRAPPIA